MIQVLEQYRLITFNSLICCLICTCRYGCFHSACGTSVLVGQCTRVLQQHWHNLETMIRGGEEHASWSGGSAMMGMK